MPLFRRSEHVGNIQEAPTESLPVHAAASDEEHPGHRFLPGTRFGKRFRIVELLGRGGMGEVYRADDLQLGQSVALKFLPRHLTDDPSALARMRNEVRVARQISQANVCRVHDIGQADDHYFLSMEYIDGEDLGSVLRRLGRPTQEKSIEIARQLCLGLAAAHEAGVLHRDLKPANIMIDGRGRVRITDFGLAGFAAELPRAERVGTPSYMAPELFSGGSASARSDIYALGAVLYELFTGRKAFESDSTPGFGRRASSTPTRPSDFVPDIEPVIEEIILRCLDGNPQRRPASALAVAAVLPGIDLVAAALASGQTPSPEIVAAAGGPGALKPAIAAACGASVLAGVALIAALNSRVALHGLAPPAEPAVILEDRGRTILERLGYAEAPFETASGYTVYWDYLDHIEASDPSPDRWKTLPTRRPTAHWFWYRESPDSMAPLNPEGRIRLYDPPLTKVGMVGLKMDDQGRLGLLHVVPPRIWEDAGPAEPVDFAALFEVAGLDPADFEPAEPRWNPDVYVDGRAAWTGHYPEQPDWPLRVEAASYAGRVVHFNVLEVPFEPLLPKVREAKPLFRRPGDLADLLVLIIVLTLPPLIARRNLRRGTGDRRAAMRVGVGIFALAFLAWILSTDHSPVVKLEVDMFLVGLGMSVFFGVWAALAYLALEPHVRRLWPQVLISWTRLVMGRFGDPRVGRDVLFGALAGVLVIVVQRVEWLVPGWFGVAPGNPIAVASEVLLGGRKALALVVDPFAFADPLVILLVLTLSLVLVRKRAVAVMLTLALFVIADDHWNPGMGFGVVGLAALAEAVIIWSLMLFTLIRFGLLSLVTAFLFLQLLQRWPLTLDVSAWFWGTSVTVIVLMTAIAALAAHASIGRRAVSTVQ